MKKLIIIISSIVLTIAIAVGVVVIIMLNNGNKNNDENKDYRNIKVEFLSDKGVEIYRNNDKMDAFRGMQLRSGDRLVTDVDAYSIIKLDNDKYLHISENSNIDIISSEYDKSLTRIRINEGSIVTEVKNKLSNLEQFEIETPNTSMSIRGTTFGVDVNKIDNAYEINYKLIEGSIEIRIFENNIDTIDVSKFILNEMEELNIRVEDEAIIDKDNLNTILEKYRSNDKSINVKEFIDVNDFISKTKKIILVYRELETVDISDELKAIPSNHDENYKRLVSVSSTFNINNDEDKTNYIKYEQQDNYEVTVKAVEKDGYYVDYWLVNGNKVISDYGDEIIITVDESILVEPIYKELFNTIIKSTDYNSCIFVNNVALTKETTYSELKLDLKYVEDDLALFSGWYLINGNEEQLLSSDEEYTYIPDADGIILAKVLDAHNITVGFNGAKTDNAILVNNELINNDGIYKVADGINLKFNLDINFDGWYIITDNGATLYSAEKEIKYSPTDTYSHIEARYSGNYNTTIKQNEYDNSVLVNDVILKQETTYDYYSLPLEYKNNDKIFIGWYRLDGTNEELLSQNKKYTYIPTSNSIISAKYRDKYVTTIISNEYNNSTNHYIKVNGNYLTKETTFIENGNPIRLSFLSYVALFDGWYIVDETGVETLLSSEENYNYTPTSSETIICKYNKYHNLNIFASDYSLNNIEAFGNALTGISMKKNQTNIDIKYNDVAGYTYLGIYKLDDNMNEVELLTTDKEYNVTLNEDMNIKIKFIQNPYDDITYVFYPRSTTYTYLPISSSSIQEINVGEEFDPFAYDFSYSLAIESPTAVQIAEIKAEDASKLISCSYQDASGADVDNIDTTKPGRYYVTYWLINEPSIRFNDALFEIVDENAPKYNVDIDISSISALQYIHIDGLSYTKRISGHIAKEASSIYISFGDFSREINPTIIDNVIFLGIYELDDNNNKTLLTTSNRYSFIPTTDIKLYIDYVIYTDGATPKLQLINNNDEAIDSITASSINQYNENDYKFIIASDEDNLTIELNKDIIVKKIYDSNNNEVQEIDYNNLGTYKIVYTILNTQYEKVVNVVITNS